MRLLNRVRSWWRGIFQRSLVQNEMEAELQFHVEARAEELAQSGVPRAESPCASPVPQSWRDRRRGAL